jgi:hypothetical protein
MSSIELGNVCGVSAPSIDQRSSPANSPSCSKTKAPNRFPLLSFHWYSPKTCIRKSFGRLPSTERSMLAQPHGQREKTHATSSCAIYGDASGLPFCSIQLIRLRSSTVSSRLSGIGLVAYAIAKGLTLKATGTQQLPRSGNLLLCVRVGRPVRLHHTPPV